MSSSADDASCDTALLSSQNNSRPVRRCRLISIEPVMFLASIAVGMLVPVTQQYIYKRMSEDYAQEHVIDNTTTRIVEQQSSKWVMYLTLSFLIPSFFSSLILGSCSDQFGRKSVLLFPFIGSASRQLVTIIVVGFNLNVAYLFIGNVMDGICGGTGVIVMSCFAYLSDITTHQQRTIRVVILECSGSIGLILGSLVTGYLIRYFGFLWPNVVIVILTAVTVLYIIFVIENNTKQNSQSGVTKLNHLWEPLKLYLKDDGTHRRWKLTLIMFIMFLVMIVDFGRLDCESFHLLSYPFSWNSVKIGYYSATVQLMRMLASVILARLIMHWTGDLGLLLISCLSGVIYEILFALAESIGVIFLGKYTLSLSKV